MANSYFQFKQFRVEQDKCAMKVCTDSCVFGAYVNVAQAKRILDIGTGTGLLALMAAQRTNATVDAVEINPDAQIQAKENFSNSPWAAQLQLHAESLQQFAKHSQQHYDLILSNPPFFLSSLKSDNTAKNMAKHTGELLFEDILVFTKQHLIQQGKLCLLLPPPEAAYFAKLASAYKIHLSETVEVYTRIGGKCIRHIQTYAFELSGEPIVKKLFIKDENDVDYTTGFKELLRAYYLFID
ncbi:tRNA1(Val) (adenine(37)-N6)-methyltransferase [Pontibacter silvestris]|uniref:tRNA1(Val) (adenine(37)-N6)-methyltransferase n=1 Tax=Pontibacter silvestris TaxID=2305183 RepID=A0ABW4WS28_9BACT|nr:methyltransferase [Pontibacter silvestris]MCC9136225.1 methyltransferase [Pontibacter silvestris]